eukprot:742904-Hanusia_phi.AAC.2
MSKSDVLNLYRNLLRNSKKFCNYNFREYFLRRTKEDFKLHKNESDPSKIQQLLERARKELVVISRQATLSQMYSADRPFILEQSHSVK